MIRLLWAASTNIRYFLRLYMPSNILLDVIRTRRGLKWGVPAMMLAFPYLVAANACTHLINDGGPGWLHLLVLVFLWDMFKMLWIGPISVLLLVRARVQETAGTPARSTTARHDGYSRPARSDGGCSTSPMKRSLAYPYIAGSDPNAATTARPDRATASDHGRPDSRIVDSELGSDLSQCQTLSVEPRSVLTDRLWQLRLTRGYTSLPGNLPNRATVHPETCRQLPNRHPSGVPNEQFSPIGDAQTGLRLMRISPDRTSLIDDLRSLSTRPTTPSPLNNMGNQRTERLPRV